MTHFASCAQPTYFIFFLIVPATTEFYTLSLHDALPIYRQSGRRVSRLLDDGLPTDRLGRAVRRLRLRRTADRKSTRLNSSHQIISYAVFCLKKKNFSRQKNTIII